MDLSNLADIFYEEAQEYFDEIEANLLSINIESPDSEDLGAIFRCAHSIKGGAGTFGFSVLQDSTHLFENALDDLRHAKFKLTQEVVDGLLEINDLLREQLIAYQSGETPDSTGTGIVKDIVESVCRNQGSEAPMELESTTHDTASASVQTYSMKLLHLDDEKKSDLEEELGILGTVNVKNEILTLETDDDLDNILLIVGFILEDDECEALSISLLAPEEDEQDHQKAEEQDLKTETPSPTMQSAASPGNAVTASSTKKSSETSLRVPVRKIDQIINLVGEMVITQSMLEQASQTGNRDISNELALLERNARDLQEAVMSVRMVPMETVFSRFPRQVRDISKRLNKKVDLITEGESTELDKSMVEKIIDPLSHLVRNSLDHGIEQPDERVAKGKSEIGKLTLSAKHQGGNIIIEVIDDGAGLNREKLLEKSRRNGIPVSDNMSDEEVWQLIFAPGFSTASEVTDVSGRGVGMDVVRKNIHTLGGAIHISSGLNKGTRTQISLPLTLAILDGMALTSHGETYILPLSTVRETLQPSKENVFTMAKDDQVLKVRNDYLPIVYLGQALKEKEPARDITKAIAIIIQADGRRYAMIVDDLLGQQQVVVKNMETNYKKIKGFSAATILGDGRVSLILDVNEIFELNRGNK